MSVPPKSGLNYEILLIASVTLFFSYGMISLPLIFINSIIFPKLMMAKDVFSGRLLRKSFIASIVVCMRLCSDIDPLLSTMKMKTKSSPFEI